MRGASLSCFVNRSKAHLRQIFRVVFEIAERGIESKVISAFFIGRSLRDPTAGDGHANLTDEVAWHFNSFVVINGTDQFEPALFPFVEEYAFTFALN